MEGTSEMRTSLLALVGSSLVSVALVVACSSSTCEDKGTCAGPGVAEAGGADADADGGMGADVVQPPAGCDAAAEPKDAPKCVVSEYGVFVDASGADTNAGTKDAPVKTIGAALGKLAGKTRVYVCEGTYAEHVKLTSAVAIYGGFACGTWSYTGNKPKVAPADVGYAIEIAGVNDATVIEDVSFTAAAGTAASTSSVAAFVNASAKVTLRRVELVAGKGFAGTAPAKAADGALMTSTPTAGTLNGNAGGATNGGLAQLCTCVGAGTSKGGGGGNLNSDGSPGETAQASPSPMTATGLGSTLAECAGGQGGRPGSNAPNATPGADAKKLGTLTDSGWTPEPGTIGTAGTAGQGGGGGGGSAGGGGGGACGGCGGSAGQPGAGGGASIALLTLASPVALTQCTLTASDAGTGATGGIGGDGIAGGTKGAFGGAACSGGNGGKGGNGGAGGGGAGGISIGVLYKGPKPTVDATIKTGLKGAPANAALDGQSADSLEVQ
jgi:hypothetical protein